MISPKVSTDLPRSACELPLSLGRSNGFSKSPITGVKNIPFFAPNIAYDDLIIVEDDNGELFFYSLIKPSGHSTIQIIFFDLQHLEQITNDLVGLRCAWEGSHLRDYISVDVPKKVNYGTVRKYLIQKREEKQLDFQEACLAHEYDRLPGQ